MPSFATQHLDIAPTVLQLLGVPVPSDMDGRVLTELLGPTVPRHHLPAHSPVLAERTPAVLAELEYSAEDDAAIQRRLTDLGYL